MAQEAEVDEWTATAVKSFGRLDGAANVAGLSKRQLDTTTANIVCTKILLMGRMLIYTYISRFIVRLELPQPFPTALLVYFELVSQLPKA